MTQFDPDAFHIRELRINLREALDATAKLDDTCIPMTIAFRAGKRSHGALVHLCKIKDEDSLAYYDRVWARVSRIIRNRLDPI